MYINLIHGVIKMAFIRKSGSRFQIRQGNTGELHSTFSTRKAAEEEIARLHKKNMPKQSNRGASASKKNPKGKK